MNEQLQLLPVDDIFSDEDFNSRGAILPSDVMDLAGAIRAKGLMSPILVVPWTETPGKKYRIVAGHRRFAAISMILRDATIKAIVREDLVGKENEQIFLNLIENKERKAPNILQEAKAIEKLLSGGVNVAKIARELNANQNWVKLRLDLLHEDDHVKAEVAKGFISQEHLKTIIKMSSPEDKYEFIKKLKNALDRNEKIRHILPDKKTKEDYTSKKQRKAGEIRELGRQVYELFGPSLGTRITAWAAGDISAVDVWVDICIAAKREDITCYPPNEIRNEVIGGCKMLGVTL